MKKTAWLWMGLGAAAIAYGCGGSSGSGPGGGEEYGTSITRMNALTNGMLLYTNDWDDTYPPANRWMDALGPYVQDNAAFVSPALEGQSGVYGYALNADLAGTNANDVEDPYNTPLLFDSTVLTRNATAATSTMPSPPRYGNANTISYANGRVLGGNGNNPTSGEVGRSRLKSVMTGLLLYASDNDDHLPLANQWVDGTMPYVKVDQYYRSPALAYDPNAYGFAFNAEVAGKSLLEFDIPALKVGVFDSKDITRNATTNPENRPNPPRYPGGNLYGTLDGNVVFAQ